LAYFGNLRPTEEGSSVLEKAPINAPVGAGAQIPGQSDPSVNPPVTPGSPSPATPNGAGQIPK
jgi:hypothetical protein